MRRMDGPSGKRGGCTAPDTPQRQPDLGTGNSRAPEDGRRTALRESSRENRSDRHGGSCGTCLPHAHRVLLSSKFQRTFSFDLCPGVVGDNYRRRGVAPRMKQY